MGCLICDDPAHSTDECPHYEEPTEEPDRRQGQLEERRRAREFNALLERSSLAEDRLWADCPIHGRQARDPFTDRCILC